MAARYEEDAFRLERGLDIALQHPARIADLHTATSVSTATEDALKGLRKAGIVADIAPVQGLRVADMMGTYNPVGDLKVAAMLGGSIPTSLIQEFANAGHASNIDALTPSWQPTDALYYPLSQYMSTMSVAERGISASSWKPALMRWVEPPPAILSQYANSSLAISDAVQPVISLATTQVLRDVCQAPLHDFRVLIENSVQFFDLELPLLGELVPDIQRWPDYPPNSAPLEPAPSKQPDLDSAPPPYQITKEGSDEAVARAVKQAVEQAVEQCKTPVLVRIRDGLITAIVIKIAVEYVHVDDYVVRIAVKGVQVVVNGVSYFTPYL